MNDIRNGKVYAALFMLFLVVLIVGGYFLTVQLTSSDNKSKGDIESIAEKNEDYKVEQDKDYIYFVNSEQKSVEHEIIYQDIVMNFQGVYAASVASTLNSKMALLKETYKKLSEQDLTDEEQDKVLYKEDDIYSASYLKYTRYFYKNYASLLIDEYDFNCFDGELYRNSISYVFDVTTGDEVSKKELLNTYHKSLEAIKGVIKEKLEKNQTIVEEKEVIDIASTINNLDNEENYALYINKSGFLVISYLVKTTQVDYNDVIILN